VNFRVESSRRASNSQNRAVARLRYTAEVPHVDPLAAPPALHEIICVAFRRSAKKTRADGSGLEIVAAAASWSEIDSGPNNNPTT
jgi:hypothetical protein